MLKEKRMNEFIITCVVAFFILGGAVYQAWSKLQSDQKAEKNDLLRRAAESELKDLQVLQLEKQSHLLSKSDSIILNNLKVIDSQEETLKNVLGFGIPKIITFYNANRDLCLSIKNDNPYPFRHVYVSIVDWSNGLKSKMVDNTLKESDLKGLRFTWAKDYISGFNKEDIPFEIYFKNPKSLEIYIGTEHGSFIVYLLATYDQNSDLVKSMYRTYEIDRKSLQFRLVDQDAPGKANDLMVEKMFYTKPYQIINDL